MTTRLRLLLGVLAAIISLGAGYYLWPDSRSLEATLRREVGTLYVVRVEPVSDASIQAFVESFQPLVPFKVVATRDWSIDERRQLEWDEDKYDATMLLERLREATPRDKFVLGVTDQAMHDEEHWWLYGKAGIDSHSGIISTAHLWVEGWERDWRQPLFRERLGKVGVHEFGHAAGFSHCSDPKCVMWFASEISMVDRTFSRFCRDCETSWLLWHQV